MDRLGRGADRGGGQRKPVQRMLKVELWRNVGKMAEKAGEEGGRRNQERLVGGGNESNERQGSSQAEQHFRKKLLEDKRFTEEVVAFLKVGEAREGIVLSGG